MARDITSPNGNVLRNVPDEVADDDPRVLAKLAKLDRAETTRANIARENARIGETEVGEGLTGFREGIGAGLSRVGRAAYNLAAVPFRTEAEREAATQESRDIAELEKPLRATGRGAAGAFVGETAATLPIGGAASLGVKTLGARAALPLATRIATSPYGRGALEGAVVGGITSEPGERGFGAALGGGFGVAGAGAGRLLNRALSGQLPSLAAKRLERQGVELTPGLRASRLPGGQARQIAIAEQAGTSIPVLGSAPAAARESSETQFAKLFAETAAPPGAKPNLTGNARVDLDRLRGAYEDAYQKALAYPVHTSIFKTGADIPIKSLFAKAASKGVDIEDFTDPKLLRTVSKVKGVVDASDIHRVRSDVRNQIAKLRKSESLHPEFGDRLRAAQTLERELTEVLESQAPTKLLKQLKDIDASYRNFATYRNAVERAVAQLPSQGGQLTTAQIMRGVVTSAAERGDKKSLVRGTAPMQELAEQGLKVFGQDVPQTGTLTRYGGAALGLPLSVAYSAGLSPTLSRGIAPSLRALPLTRAVRRSQFRQEPGRIGRMALQESIDEEGQ